MTVLSNFVTLTKYSMYGDECQNKNSPSFADNFQTARDHDTPIFKIKKSFHRIVLESLFFHASCSVAADDWDRSVESGQALKH